jgi:hypothetical protein
MSLSHVLAGHARSDQGVERIAKPVAWHRNKRHLLVVSG